MQPSIRLITALQEGITKRSDVFLARNYLNSLEQDYCNDLLKDTCAALKCYENINDTYSMEEKCIFKSFTFDFKSLYDSLKPELVLEALAEAMNICRKECTEGFKDWILKLINFSQKSAIGVFEEKEE